MKFSSYLTGNTLRPCYKDQPVMLLRETVSFYCENHTKHKICGQNAEFQCVRAGGVLVYSNYSAVKG
jgi:hypothetical protein